MRVSPAPEHDAATSKSWEAVRRLLENASDAESRDAVQFIFDSPLTSFRSHVATYAEESFPPGTPMLAGAIDLMRRIHEDFRYDTTVTDATTAVDRVFEIRAGGLSGSGPCRHRLYAQPGPARALCVGLFADPSRAGTGTDAGGRTPAMPGSRSGHRLSAGSIWTPPMMSLSAKVMSPSPMAAIMAMSRRSTALSWAGTII